MPLTRSEREKLNRHLAKTNIWSPGRRRAAVTRVAELAAKLVVLDNDPEHAPMLLAATKYLDSTEPSDILEGDVRKAYDQGEQGWTQNPMQEPPETEIPEELLKIREDLENGS